MCLIFIEHTLWFSAFVAHHIIVFLKHILATFGLLSPTYKSSRWKKKVKDTHMENSK